MHHPHLVLAPIVDGAIDQAREDVAQSAICVEQPVYAELEAILLPWFWR